MEVVSNVIVAAFFSYLLYRMKEIELQLNALGVALARMEENLKSVEENLHRI